QAEGCGENGTGTTSGLTVDTAPKVGRTGEGTPSTPSFQSVAQGGLLSDVSRNAGLSDKNVRSTQDLAHDHVWPTQEELTSQLPEAIEELRRRFSGRELPVPVIWDERKVKSPTEYLTVADRKGVPTFGTFKAGYLPGRGLLYSTIVHEVGLFVFFLLFTYGLPAPRAQKLRANSNIQDHLIYLPELGGGTEGQKSPGG